VDYPSAKPVTQKGLSELNVLIVEKLLVDLFVNVTTLEFKHKSPGLFLFIVKLEVLFL